MHAKQSLKQAARGRRPAYNQSPREVGYITRLILINYRCRLFPLLLKVVTSLPFQNIDTAFIRTDGSGKQEGTSSRPMSLWVSTTLNLNCACTLVGSISAFHDCRLSFLDVDEGLVRWWLVRMHIIQDSKGGEKRPG